MGRQKDNELKQNLEQSNGQGRTEQKPGTQSKKDQTRGYKFLYMVEDKFDADGQKLRSFWTKVGVAWENRDGSWSIDLSAYPVHGRLQMRDPKKLEAAA